ncbi:MAG: CoA ligase, partial [Burkholderiales bacterium]|nr:CoA ligase [Burkholderiales bacterium]
VAGKRSSLAHLNFHLNRIEGVQDGAFWLPDENPGDVARPVAFVVAPGLAPASVPALVIGALRRQLEPAFVPRRVVVVPTLPREATGKLTAAALRAYALATLGAAAAARAVDGDGVGEVHIAADHPALAGHFPGRPMLPGAVLLSLVMQALEREPALRARLGAAPCIGSAKFLRPVGPGTRLRIVLQPQDSGVAFEVQAGGQAVARGRLGTTPG